jgi:hypothetical protein
VPRCPGPSGCRQAAEVPLELLRLAGRRTGYQGLLWGFQAGWLAWGWHATYTLSTEFAWSDQSYADHATTLAPIAFTMRRPQTRTTLTATTANPRYGQVITLRVTSRDERPTGYFANKYGVVRVQHYVAGQWLTLRGGQPTTNSYGTAAMRYRFAPRHATPRHAERYRAVTLSTEDYTRSTSTTAVLR